MSTGHKAPLVHSPTSNQAPYRYRSGTGMVPSAEWNVFFDDFHSFVVGTSITNGPVANTPWGWQGAIIDTGATVTVDTTAALGANGTLLITDATASEGAAVYGTKSIQLTSGKKFWMEARVRTDDVTDTTIQFGLSDLTATTNPEDIWTTVADNFIAFGISDGSFSRDIRFLTSAGNQTNSSETSATYEMVANTWHVLAWQYDGTKLHGFIDGQLALTWSQASTTIPTGVAMAPFFGALNGNGAGGNNHYFDYIRWVSER